MFKFSMRGFALWSSFLVAALVLSAGEARGQGAETDRAALEALYHATGGPNWADNTNWLSDAPLGEWYGVQTQNDRVQALNLKRNELSGPMPSELGQLANLTSLDLGDNELSGPIPPELGQLGNLVILELPRNQLTAPIPPELAQLANLQRLNLSFNPLAGPIPPELGQLANLQHLFFYNSQLSGPIPPELARLANLFSINLSGNQLSGPIPPELARLANLWVLHLSDNQLSGPIPPELGQLANFTLLNLGDNQLSGPIPAELGRLANLQQLRLSGNQLSGPIPLELGQLNQLESLTIDNDTGLCLPPEMRDAAFGRLAIAENLALCDGVTPNAAMDVQQAVNDAIGSATNGAGLSTTGAAVTVPFGALFTFTSSPPSAVRQVTYAGMTFSVSSTAPGVVGVSTTAGEGDGAGVVLTPGAEAGTARVTVEARPEGQLSAGPAASVMFDVEVHATVPALPAVASVLLALLLSVAALRRRAAVPGGRG